MRKDEFVIRGQTEHNGTETLNFSGFKPGYAYRMVEFSLYPKQPNTSYEISGTVTANKTAADAANPNFNDDGLIACALVAYSSSAFDGGINEAVVNDTFLITQNLILKVKDASSGNNPINWQCKFQPVKMSKAEEAVTNYKQFLISDD